MTSAHPPGVDVTPCLGPLIWYDVGDCDALLECANCGYLIVAGNFHDVAHHETPLLREGLSP